MRRSGLGPSPAVAPRHRGSGGGTGARAARADAFLLQQSTLWLQLHAPYQLPLLQQPASSLQRQWRQWRPGAASPPLPGSQPAAARPPRAQFAAKPCLKCRKRRAKDVLRAASALCTRGPPGL